MNYTYPHTIENGGGESLTFVRRLKDENGVEYVEVENLVQPNSGPPMHVHHKQAESLTVVKGKIGIQRPGEKPEFFGEGQTVTFEAGEAHKFWNAGAEPLVCSGWVKPVHNIEYFLTEIYRSTKENGGKAPHPMDAAYLSMRYKSEFDMTEIPAFVKQFIFPATVFIGKLSGRFKKYEGAPMPEK